MNRTTVIRTAAAFGFLAVALGAFGAHGLKDLLTEKNLSYWEKAVFYQFVHLAGFILLLQTERISKIAFACFVAGIACFSGSLYILALIPFKPLVFITPLGGLLLLAGWVALFISCNCSRSSGRRAETGSQAG